MPTDSMNVVMTHCWKIAIYKKMCSSIIMENRKIVLLDDFHATVEAVDDNDVIGMFREYTCNAI